MEFNEILGNEETKKILLEQLYHDVIVHSYMFVGQEGIGKKIIATEFARMALCQDINKIKLCENCESCAKFKSNNHPDFELIEPDGNHIKISQIRQMQEDIYVKPILSKKKIFIINDADLMTEEAQNSLLKILEEPPEYVTIILIVRNESMMLNTIKSRCMKINFTNISDKDMQDYIEKYKLIENPSNSILKLCNGSIGKLHKIKENIDIYMKVEELTEEITRKNRISVIDLLKKSEFIYQSKEEINTILEYMIIIVYLYISNITQKNDFIFKYYFDIIKIIKNTLVKVQSNTNYDMCIDEMLFCIADKIH